MTARSISARLSTIHQQLGDNVMNNTSMSVESPNQGLEANERTALAFDEAGGVDDEHLDAASSYSGDRDVERAKVHFVSGDTQCAAWHYPGTNGACVIMAGGFAVTMGPGTERFAMRFNAAGFTVLAFDYRHLGDSGGQPRQIVRLREQLADWQAAIAFAPTLPGVDPTRVAIWGFSVSGGHVLRVAARNPKLAAAIAQTPNADGQAAARNATRHQRPLALLRFTNRAVLDALGGLVGRRPLLVALAGEPGTVALLTTSDAVNGGRALDPDNRYPDWQQEVAARSALRVTFYRPGRYATRVRCPLLVVVCDQDQSALAGPALRAAKRAPAGELVRMPGGHYEPFLGGHEHAAEAELAFLRRQLLDHSSPAVSDSAGSRTAPLADETTRPPGPVTSRRQPKG
jgi:pimeloyl-ACP methyl ester carboxylesterase